MYETIWPDQESQLTVCHYSLLHQPPEQNHQQVSNNLLKIFGQAIVKISASSVILESNRKMQA
jgi:hypothetical protein